MTAPTAIEPRVPRANWLAAVLLVTAVFLLGNHGLLLGTETPLWDAQNQFRPFFSLVADAARKGQLLGWDPWTYAGAPLFAEPQVGALSPLVVLAAFVCGSSGAGYVAFWLFVWWLGGAGILCLARHVGAPVWGGVTAALGFLFCGLYTGHAQHLSWLVSFSLSPFVLWRFDEALRSRRRWPAVETGALWGLSACGGYPGLTIASGLFLALFGLGRALAPTNRTPFGCLAQALALVVAVGLGAMSATYVAFFRAGAGHHDRTGVLPRDVALFDNALDPGAIATLTTPTLAAQKAKDLVGLWPNTDVSSVSIYLGIGCLLLAGLGVALRPRSFRRGWLLLLAALALGCAVGGHLPLRGWLYDWLPPTRYFRHSTLFRSLFLLAIAHLALLGSREVATLLASERPARRRSLLLATAALCVAGLGTIVWHCAATSWSRPLLWATVAVGPLSWGAAGALGALLAIASPAARRRWVPFGFVALAVLDAGTTRFVNERTICYDDSGALAFARELDAAHSASFDLAPAGALTARAPWDPAARYKCNTQVVQKRPCLGGYTTQQNRFHERIERDPRLAAMALGTERFWFASEAPEVPWDDAHFAALRARAEALGTAPLVLHAAADLGHAADSPVAAPHDLAALPACRPARIAVRDYHPDVFEFDFTAAAAGWLLVTDRWAPDWLATVNGLPVPVRCANFVFRAVPVQQGENRIRFTYATGLYTALTLASWVLLGAVAAGSLWRWRRARAAN